MKRSFAQISAIALFVSFGTTLGAFAAPPAPIAKTAPAASAQETYRVLPPEQFFGAAQMGYMAAKLAPEVCAKLFCYCGCDITDSHGRLLDCFESYHGVDCHICVEEAMEALKLKRDGKTIAEIQQQVDQMFSDKYPFQQETDKLKQYKASRLYKPNTAEEAKASAARANDPNRKPLLKGASKDEPGCCANDHKK